MSAPAEDTAVRRVGTPALVSGCTACLHPETCVDVGCYVTQEAVAPGAWAWAARWRPVAVGGR